MLMDTVSAPSGPPGMCSPPQIQCPPVWALGLSMLNDSPTPGLGGPETAQVPVSVKLWPACCAASAPLERLFSC